MGWLRRFIRRRRYVRPRNTAYVACRLDGKYWAGEWKWQGKTFTTSSQLAYKWGTPESCEAAIIGNQLRNVVVKQVELDQFVKRPQTRRAHHARRR